MRPFAVVFLAVVSASCSASTEPTRPALESDKEDYSVCGRFKEGAPCDRSGTALGSCMCGGFSYPVGRTACCENGIVQITQCSEWPIGCSGSYDAGRNDVGADTASEAAADAVSSD